MGFWFIPIRVPAEEIHVQADRRLAFQVLTAWRAAGPDGKRTARVLEESGDRLLVEFHTSVAMLFGLKMVQRTVEWVTLEEPGHIEFEAVQGLLPVVTRFESSKQTHQVSGTVSAGCGLLSRSVGAPIAGYEIHMGVTTVDPSGPTDTSLSGQEAVVHPFRLSRPSAGRVHHGDGSITESGWIMGTYVHGMFHNGELRRNILKSIAARKGVSLPSGGRDFSQSAEYDKLADVVRASLDIDELYRVAGLAVK